MAFLRGRVNWLGVALAGLLLADVCCATVGFQQVTIPDHGGKSMQAGIWSPSNIQTSMHPLGL